MKDDFQITAVYENSKASQGEGLTIHYGFRDGEYGPMLRAKTARGLCWLAIAKDRTAAFQKMKANWPKARFVEIDMMGVTSGEIALDLYGTPFQIAVWKELLKIPRGKTVSYQDIARAIGRPLALRAVGTAVGVNPIGVIIPCHRVIRADGGIGGYAWGVDMKKSLLGNETSHAA